MLPPKPSADRLAADSPADAAAVCKVLSDTLGRAVTSKKAAPGPLNTPAKLFAVYMADESLVSVCVCDVAFAAYTGAALALLPAGVAAESIKAGNCAAELRENFAEVLNICRQSFHRQPLHLGPPRLYPAARELPPAVAAVLLKPKSRLDLDITIAGYGTGRLSILS